MKNVLATLLGLITASVTVYILETLIGHNLFPLPQGADPMDINWIKNNMDLIPLGSKLFIVIAHFAGIIAGMFVAAKISNKSMIPSYIVGGIMLAATLFNIVMLPKELWFSLSDGLLAIIAFVLGKSLAAKHLRG